MPTTTTFSRTKFFNKTHETWKFGKTKVTRISPRPHEGPNLRGTCSRHASSGGNVGSIEYTPQIIIDGARLFWKQFFPDNILYEISVQNLQIWHPPFRAEQIGSLLRPLSSSPLAAPPARRQHMRRQFLRSQTADSRSHCCCRGKATVPVHPPHHVGLT